MLIASEHATYEYPVDGWYWFDSEEDAREFFWTAAHARGRDYRMKICVYAISKNEASLTPAARCGILLAWI
jgi:hypothetical protein